MPQLSDTMTEAKILVWRKNVGDRCSRGDILAEVETDKANLEIECFSEGYLVEIMYPEGSVVKVGETIAKISDSVEAVSEATSTSVERSVNDQVTSTDQTSAEAAREQIETGTVKKSSLSTNAREELPGEKSTSFSLQPNLERATHGVRDFESAEHRVKASPLAKRIAKEQGVSLTQIRGSGPEGRIVARDLDTAKPGVVTNLEQQTTNIHSSLGPQPTHEIKSTTHMQELSKMRKAIAQGMVKSFSEIPHFYLKTSVIADRLIEFRNSLKQLPAFERLTYTHLILKAAGLAIKEVDIFNSRLEGDSLLRFDDVDIGIVVSVDDGLLVPVVRAVDKAPLHDLVSTADTLVNKARQRRLSPQDLSGGCFSISNLGMFDVEEFSAIIYPGHTGILAVSAISKQPGVENDQVVIKHMMTLTLSVDHRVADGIAGARLLTEIKRYLEKPELLLV